MATQGKLNVQIGADTTPMTAGLAKAAAGLRSFLTLGSMASAARQAIAYGSAINDAAIKSGVGVKWLQATAYAAKLAGSSLEELSTSLIELRRAQGEALGGSKGDAAAFAALGITQKQLGLLSAEELFDRIGDSVRQSNGAITQVNAALQVLGRGGKGLLAGLVDGFSEARAEAERLGLVLEGSTIRAMDQLGDRLDAIKLKLTSITAVVLKNLADPKTWKAWEQVINLTSPAIMYQEFFRGGPKGFSEAKLAQFRYLMELVSEYESDSTSEQGQAGRPANPTQTARGKRQRAAVSDLARIGGYMSGGSVGGNPLLRVQNQALIELRQMRGVLTRIANRQPGESITW